MKLARTAWHVLSLSLLLLLLVCEQIVNNTYVASSSMQDQQRDQRADQRVERGRDWSQSRTMGRSTSADESAFQSMIQSAITGAMSSAMSMLSAGRTNVDTRHSQSSSMRRTAELPGPSGFTSRSWQRRDDSPRYANRH